jgi:hypothetical protein
LIREKQAFPLFDLTSNLFWAQWGTLDERRINRFILHCDQEDI